MHLSLTLIGSFEARLDGQAIGGFQSNKARALLAYLAVEAACCHSRQALAGLLWPDVPEACARHSLSQTLCNLRSVLHEQVAACPYFLVSPHAIQFNCYSDHWLDVAEFGSLVDACQSTELQALHQAVALYRGPFLDGLSLADGVGFEEWAAIQRERHHRLLMEALYRLTVGHEARGELEEALRLAWRQVELDPWREEAHLQAMRLLARTGRRSEALVQYGICRRLLAIELGVEPTAETTRLYERIRDGVVGEYGA